MGIVVKQLDFANEHGVTRQAVAYAQRKGNIDTGKDNMIIVDGENTQAWILKNNAKNKAKKTPAKKPIKKVKPTPKKQTPDPVSVITQAELASLAGVTHQTLNKAINSGHVSLTDDRKVIFNSDLTKLWLAKQQAKRGKAPVDPTKNNKDDENPEGKGLVELQREKFVQEIGKIKADKNLKELQLLVRRGELIEKETIAGVLFQYLNALNINILNVPDIIIDDLIDKVRSDCSRGDIIKNMRAALQKEIKKTKKQIESRI